MAGSAVAAGASGSASPDGVRKRGVPKLGGGPAAAARGGGGGSAPTPDDDDDDEVTPPGFPLWLLLLACAVAFLLGRLSMGA